MVFGNIRDLKDYGYLEEEVLKCFEYAKTHDLLNFEKGSHEIEGDNLFVNIVEYKTTTRRKDSGKHIVSTWICI